MRGYVNGGGRSRPLGPLVEPAAHALPPKEVSIRLAQTRGKASRLRHPPGGLAGRECREGHKSRMPALIHSSELAERSN